MPDHLVHVWTNIVNISWFVYAKTDQICCQRIKKAINMRFLHVEGKLSNQN